MPFVRPAALPSVTEGDALEDLFQATLVGVTGLAGELVRPRWQPEPPNMPDFADNWCAFGVTVMPADKFVYLRQVDDETVELECSEELAVLVSFYGPASQRIAGEWRDGLQIDQNRADLQAQAIKLVESLDQRQVPALLKQVWTKRIDAPSRWRRWVRRRYLVNSIESLGAGLDNEFYITPIIVSPPP